MVRASGSSLPTRRTYRAIYTYAWDLADVPLPDALQEITALGVNTVTIAGSYHAGKFLRPHGRSCRVYFPEDGTVYFKPDLSRYGRITPVLNSLVRERDVLGELAADARVATNVWLVLLHNSRLGEVHPHATVRNAFGDRYVYSLCPSAPDAREYAVALCRDVTETYAVSGISIETPGFLPYAHGFHHEFAMVPPNAWLDAQLGLCFCDHCLAGGESAGIDTRRLQARVREDVDSYLDGMVDLPADMAEAAWRADVATGHDLSRFVRWRCEVVTSLVREIRAAVRPEVDVAIIPSVARPTAGAWYEGSDLRTLAEAAGTVEACFYEPAVSRIRADVWDTRRRLNGAGTLRGILRPGFPDLQGRSDVVAAAEALREGGVAGLALYNYGHLRSGNLAWVADAFAAFGD